MTQTPELAAAQSRDRYNGFAAQAAMRGHQLYRWEDASWPDEGGMCTRCRKYFTFEGRAKLGWNDCASRF